MAEPLEEQTIGRVSILYGEKRGKYPHGNSVRVRGGEETVLIDPSLGIVARVESLPHADRILHSHCHEDHVAGSFLYGEAPWHFHEADLPGIRSLDGLMELYGYGEVVTAAWRPTVLERFHFAPRPDALGFRGGDVFDLGGGVSIEVIHAPGHTRGHSFFRIEPDGVIFTGDVDLSSFGPYYGDAWSNLEDFEHTLAMARELDACWFLTFHHIGALEGRAAFHEKLERFAAVIAERERRLLECLGEPHTLDELVRTRFVYRPADSVAFADPVERRSISQHLARLARDGRVRELEPGRWCAS